MGELYPGAHIVLLSLALFSALIHLSFTHSLSFSPPFPSLSIQLERQSQIDGPAASSWSLCASLFKVFLEQRPPCECLNILPVCSCLPVFVLGRVSHGP